MLKSKLFDIQKSKKKPPSQEALYQASYYQIVYLRSIIFRVNSCFSEFSETI